jgi:Zn-dependent M28 family amino/carboxypeptidase
MTLQDLKNNRNIIIETIINEVGSENVKAVMNRMAIFVDMTMESDVVSFTKQIISDMGMFKQMESKDSKLTKAACRATLGMTQEEYNQKTKI